jgi:hypothetical protein
MYWDHRRHKAMPRSENGILYASYVKSNKKKKGQLAGEQHRTRARVVEDQTFFPIFVTGAWVGKGGRI